MSDTIDVSDFEKKLIKYQGYRNDSIDIWMDQLDLNNSTVVKILEGIKIIDGREIRDIFRRLVNENPSLFQQENCYITSFGQKAKSGDKILYDLAHACKDLKSKIIDVWEISTLQPNSIIVFVDDLIGTGKQSCKYITNQLNQMLSSSYETYLLCLCATPSGIDNVHDNTNFEVICGITLDEESHQCYNEKCDIFDEEEKEKLKGINDLLIKKHINFDKGLLIAFYYSVPNNTLPLIWNDGWKYKDHLGNENEWYALLPRNY